MGTRNQSLLLALGLLLGTLAGCGGGDSGGGKPQSALQGEGSGSEVAPVDAKATGASDTPLKPQGEGSSRRVTVVYTNNIDGEIEPCG